MVPSLLIIAAGHVTTASNAGCEIDAAHAATESSAARAIVTGHFEAAASHAADATEHDFVVADDLMVQTEQA